MRQNGLSGLVDSWDWSTPDPALQSAFAIEANTIAPGIVDYAQSIKTFGMSLIDAISQARNTLAMSDAQRQLLDIQIQRAQAGLPPMDTRQYIGGGSPLNQQIQSKTLLWIAGGGLLIWALSRKG